jgi:hypothetical protein
MKITKNHYIPKSLITSEAIHNAVVAAFVSAEFTKEKGFGDYGTLRHGPSSGVGLDSDGALMCLGLLENGTARTPLTLQQLFTTENGLKWPDWAVDIREMPSGDIIFTDGKSNLALFDPTIEKKESAYNVSGSEIIAVKDEGYSFKGNTFLDRGAGISITNTKVVTHDTVGDSGVDAHPKATQGLKDLMQGINDGVDDLAAVMALKPETYGWYDYENQRQVCDAPFAEKVQCTWGKRHSWFDCERVETSSGPLVVGNLNRGELFNREFDLCEVEFRPLDWDKLKPKSPKELIASMREFIESLQLGVADDVRRDKLLALLDAGNEQS